MDGDRPQVRVDVQQLAQRQQASLGTQLAGRAVEGRITDGAEQDCVATQHGVARLLWQRLLRSRHARRADGERLERKANVEPLGYRFKHAHRLRDHFGPDTVTRQHRDGVRLHACALS